VYKNWAAIAAEKSLVTRLFLMTINDSGILDLLQRAQPSLFRKDIQQPIALSKLKQTSFEIERAKEHNMGESDEDLRSCTKHQWANACDQLGIPVVEFLPGAEGVEGCSTCLQK
jgi:hypothetical protein